MNQQAVQYEYWRVECRRPWGRWYQCWYGSEAAATRARDVLAEDGYEAGLPWRCSEAEFEAWRAG